ncbi:hypothetical protein [Nocardia vaccinii]|uniref:hypothetical protein n=1 Tax=Nocardia vaccinii TaxID=1822 RepID=UPI000833FE10|nr:hypothetical protein [Nocardia vaccinii]
MNSPDEPSSRSDWDRELQFWDAARWSPRAVRGRIRSWVGATRLRRWTTGIAVVFVLMFVFPGVLGELATAQTTTSSTSETGTGTASSVNSALSWMSIRDSSGVQVSNYLFATDHGSLFHPGNTALSLVIGLEFAGWMVIVTTAIWLVGYALSFQWLNLVAQALHGVANSLTGQIATPLMLITAATIGAFFVAYFVARGFYSKATAQVVTMILIAMLSPLFLANPLADVLDSDGLLAQGRNVGISVAAGLNGQTTDDPTQLVASMQADLADNFARRPLQVWNFGHVVDSDGSCKAFWSAGVAAGNEGEVKDGMKSCGDSAAYAAASNPSVGQIGAGLLLLISGTILLLFAAYLAIKIIWSAFDAIYHGFLTIFGFAAGGYIYGPTQVFTIHNVVDGFIAGARMAVQVIALGVYVLFLGDLFEQANGQVMAVFVIGAVVEIVFIFQFGRLTSAVTRGNSWVTGRLVAAAEAGGRGGGGGGLVGMGGGTTAARTLASNRLLLDLNALNWANSSPFVAHLFGGARNPWNPNARKEMRAQKKAWRLGNLPEWYDVSAQQFADKREFQNTARRAARQGGGLRSMRGAAAALAALRIEKGVATNAAFGPMELAGIRGRNANAVMGSWGRVEQLVDRFNFADKPLAIFTTAMQLALTSAGSLSTGNYGPGGRRAHEIMTAAHLTSAEQALGLVRGRDNVVNLHGASLDYANRYFGGPRGYNGPFAGSEARIKALQEFSMGNYRLPEAKGPHAADPNTNPINHELIQAKQELLSAGIDRNEAKRIMDHIQDRHADELSGSFDRVMANPEDAQNWRELRNYIDRAQSTDQWVSGTARTGVNSMTPPGPGPGGFSPNWLAALAPVRDLLN